MDKSELKQLRDRWTAPEIIAGQTALTGKGKFPYPMLQDGCADLRGLTITEFIKNVKFRLVDLSGAKLEGFGQFGMCNVEECRFCYATLPTNIGDSFKACDFKSANLSGAVLRGRFTNCDFTSANLSSLRGSQVQFTNCVFVNTNFSKATLVHCLFENCRFEGCKFRSGSFAFSKFIRSPISQDDLGNTLMEKVVIA